jgi:hypothetical protein
MIDPRWRRIALPRALMVISQRSRPHDPSEMTADRPAEDIQPHVGTMMDAPRPYFMVMSTRWVFDLDLRPVVST